MGKLDGLRVVVKRYESPKCVSTDSKLDSKGSFCHGARKSREMHHHRPDLIFNCLAVHMSHDATVAEVIMPFYSGGNLEQYIASRRSLGMQKSEWAQIWRRILRILQARDIPRPVRLCLCCVLNRWMQVAQSIGIVHGRLLPQNILATSTQALSESFSSDGAQLLLADWDFSRTEAWHISADMYAFGQMVVSSMHESELHKLPRLLELVRSCLRTDPKTRPTPSEALHCEWDRESDAVGEELSQPLAWRLRAPEYWRCRDGEWVSKVQLGSEAILQMQELFDACGGQRRQVGKCAPRSRCMPKH